MNQSPSSPSAASHRILIVDFNAIGDLVAATPAFGLARKLFPDSEITLLTTTSSAPIVAHNPDLDLLLTVPP
ncbi:MAG: hypothetical protein HQL56_04265, partial [Magnetococcales bacterium]|nr:hypothetical protein [Magnetococcales bacterium]